MPGPELQIGTFPASSPQGQERARLKGEAHDGCWIALQKGPFLFWWL